MIRRGVSSVASASWWTLLLLPLMTALLTLSACGDENVATTRVACTNDDVCPIGQVCLRKDGFCGAVSCDFCQPGQVCYTDAAGNASCSRPECFRPTDCTAPATCIGGLCQESTCSKREDCPEGKICNLASQCVDPPEMCSNNAECPAGQICPASGFCRPGCANSSECAAGEFCSESNTCVSGCRSSMDCSAEQTCNAQNKCVCDTAKCPAGSACDPDQNKCVEGAFDCRQPQDTCPMGTFCNGATGQCEQGCTDQPNMPNSCTSGEICNLATGSCVPDNCPGKDPTSCMGDVRAPYWNPTACACVQCIRDEQCGPNETCNDNGECGTCNTPCNANTPGTCQGNTPYCVSGCCRQCIGSADCPSGQVCVSGTCGQEPDCTNNPSICPAQWTCENGRCKEPAAVGRSCVIGSTDPMMSCPFGQQCVPDPNAPAPGPNQPPSTMGVCSAAGGGFGCGTCNADCTCDGGLTCDGFACTGCMPEPLNIGGIPIPLPFGPDARCPSTGLGICLQGTCF